MVSVIMLTYNREELVGRAIESILKQTYRDFEYIIVDNGSTDRSGVIADEYAAKDDRIRVIHKERGNIGSGRNAGLEAAKGEYTAFVDDDDWIEPDYLEFLYSLIAEVQADIAICGTNLKSFPEKRVLQTEQALIELMWRKYYNVGFPTKLFKTALIGNLRFSDSAKFDDVDMMHRLIAQCEKVVYYGLPKYHVTRHENNNSAWTTHHELLTPETLDEYLRTYRARTEWLCGLFPNNAETWKYFEWSFMISMVEKIARLELPGCEEQRRNMCRVLAENRQKFLECPEILDFEKEWMEQYIPQ